MTTYHSFSALVGVLTTNKNCSKIASGIRPAMALINKIIANL